MEKNGKWFMELILSILLLIFTTLVTLMARSEEDRGLTVRALGPMMTGVTSSSTKRPEGPRAQSSPTAKPQVQPSPAGTPSSAPVESAPVNKNVMGMGEVIGTLGMWASRLDGQLTKDELDKITRQVGSLWTDQNRNLRTFLAEVNEKMNDSGTVESLQKALEGLGSAALEKKTQVITWVMDMMKDNGLKPEQIQEEVGRWISSLKLNPGDIFSGR